MSYPRYQRKVTSILSNYAKKLFGNRLFIPPNELHESVKNGMLLRGIKDENLRKIIESGSFIEDSIKNQKRDWEGRELKYLVDILEMNGQPFYLNRKSILHPIFEQLPRYVRNREYMHQILPTAIDSIEDLQKQYGADTGMIIKNIEDTTRDKELIQPLLSEELIINMINAWNILCESKGKPLPFGKSKNGKYYVNSRSPCISK